MATQWAIKHDTSRNTDLAGQTVSKNGYNVTYDDRGYVTSMSKHGTTAAGSVYAPSADAVLNTAGRNTVGASDYDKQYLSNADLQNIADMRSLAQNGVITWDQANSYANDIRSRYGYTGGNTGAEYNPTDAAGSHYDSSGNWIYDSSRALTQGGSQGSVYGGSSYANAYNNAYNNSDALLSQYMNLYNNQNSAYAQALAEQKAAQEAAVQKAVGTLEGQKTDTTNSYNDLFRQLYINKMKNQKNIGQQMAAQGINGGAAESTLLGMNTQYEDALRQGEQGRLDAIRDLDQAISDARLTGDIEGANAAASAAREQTNNYAGVLQDLINRYDSLNTQQATYDREDAENNRRYAYQTAMQILQSGNMASDELLASAGISKADAVSIVAANAADGGDVYAQLAANGATDYGTAYAMLIASGYSATNAQRLATYFAESYAPYNR